MDKTQKYSTTDEAKSVFEKHPRIMGIVIFLILFLVLDLGLGAFIIPENYQSFREKDSWFHHGIEPRQSAITNWGQKYYRFYSNSLGFRDDTVKEVPLKSDKYRILFLGDSHTEAVGIPYEKSFVGIIAKDAKDNNIELLNGSAVSYSPKIHYLKAKYLIEQKGLDVDEIFVLIDLSDLNNEIAYESFEPHRRGRFHNFLKRGFNHLSNYSLTVFSVRKISRYFENRFFTKNVAALENANMELYATFFSSFSDAELLNDPSFHHVSKWLEDEKFKPLALYSLELGQKNIRKLKNLCDEHDIKLSLSVHPWPDQIIKGDTSNIYVKSWQDFSEENDIRFVNLFPVFINNTNHLLTARKNYISHDNHWNENGHKIVAKFLEKILFDDGK